MDPKIASISSLSKPLYQGKRALENFSRDLSRLEGSDRFDKDLYSELRTRGKSLRDLQKQLLSRASKIENKLSRLNDYTNNVVESERSKLKRARRSSRKGNLSRSERAKIIRRSERIQKLTNSRRLQSELKRL